MPNKNNQNREQDVQIARLTEKIDGMVKRFDNFITNEFDHLRKDVKEMKNWLFFGFIALIAVTILTQIILKFLK